MTTHELRALVSQGENLTIEFKRKVNEPERIVREMIAFANTKGGYLLVGVNDDLTIPGLKFPEEEMLSLERAIKYFARPRLEYNRRTIELNKRRSVLVYHIPESKRKPHYILKNRKKYTFLRKGDQTLRASREMVHIFKKERKSKGEYIMLKEKEMVLFEYLKDHHFITLEQFTSVAKINGREASETLITLVSAGILEVEPDEIADKFFATEFE